MKKITVGILAHVDAGKTTLSEALLYTCGAVRRFGRVDHGDAFLDTDTMEKDRGITIFSKQASFTCGDVEFTLVDTPGHVDFSGETERALAVLDYAILVISGTDGPEAHTVTLHSLLRNHRIPTFIFVNKTDLHGFDKDYIMRALKKEISEGCIDFSDPHGDATAEEAALRDEDILDAYMSGDFCGDVRQAELVRAIGERKIFPVFFGSALKLSGIEEFIKRVSSFVSERKYHNKFGARVYKINRDPQGTRLTHIKITGGGLKTKEIIRHTDGEEEKIDQIRIYSGNKYKAVESVTEGDVCTLTGLEKTYPGEGLGCESEGEPPTLQPVLTYRMKLSPDVNISEVYTKVKLLEEEDPQLHILWNERLREIHVSIMGEVQLEILGRMLRERYGIEAEFDSGSIVYRETILDTVEGVGHFEPLRHYAEVHLLLEPGEVGSGLYFDSICSENTLDRNWQRLIMTHLSEKVHLGVLTGSPITDMKITIISGRAHIKHTEGGDFRQATYRAVRQGLMQAKSAILEPYYAFRLEVPAENIGRAMTDISQMGGDFEIENDGERAILSGDAPVCEMRSYAAEVSSYTKGRGRLTVNFGGYKRCHNEDEVRAAASYDPEMDVENSADSVFCANGAGFIVKWQDVPQYMHLESGLKPSSDEEDTEEASLPDRANKKKRLSYEDAVILDNELIGIFEQTYGPIRKRKNPPEGKKVFGEKKEKTRPRKDPVTLPEYLLVDGYNIIFAWDELKAVAKDNLGLARQLLCNMLCNYQGYRQCGLILVFDAYKVAGGRGSVEKVGGIHVVYTKEAETADAYIERVTYEMGKKYKVRVATSDSLEQIIVLGHGATRLSAKAFYDEVLTVKREIEEQISEINNNL